MTYLADYLTTLSGAEKTEIDAALRSEVFGPDGQATVIKPTTNTNSGVLNWKHDSSYGYITHFTSGPNAASGTALAAYGTDEGQAGGILVSAKNGSGAGMTLNQNPGATIGHYIQSYAGAAAIHVDAYVGSGGIRLQAKTGAGFSDGVSTTGSLTFTSATAAFTAADVGQTITQLTNVGSISPTGCIPAAATIAAVVDSQTVTLSAAATASGTGVRFRVAGRAVASTQNYLRLVDTDGSTLLGAVQYGLFDWRTPMSIASSNSAAVGLKVKAATSQSTNIATVQNAGGSDMFYVDQNGKTSAKAGSYVDNGLNTSVIALQVNNWGTSYPTIQARRRSSSMTANQVEILDESAAVQSRFNKDGVFMTRKTAAPADGDLVAGELALWFDSTAGAARLMVKAKNASGTVVTGSLALA